MGIHSGHRARVRQRFLQTGLNGFDDVNILEFLLFYAMPQQDTNPIAHALLDRFGSLHAVFEASVEELETVKGIGEYSAILLRLVPEICRRYMFSHRVKNPVLGTLEELYAYVIPLFAFHGEEHLFMLCLDSSNKVLDCSEIASGAADEVYVSFSRDDGKTDASVQDGIAYKGKNVTLTPGAYHIWVRVENDGMWLQGDILTVNDNSSSADDTP